MAGRGALLALLILCCWAWSVYTQGAGDVRFSLNGTTYQNNSLVTLEDINEGGDALLCLTDPTACCRSSGNRSTLGDWYFPNGTRVPGDGNQWDIYRIRTGQGEVILNRRRGGEEGIYHCVIPDTTGVKQTIYIGVYTASSGFPRANYLRYDSQSRNLTCSSYGGPATTVTWKKDGALITPNATYQLTKRVVDPVQGIYQVELTIDSSVGQSDIAGIYYYTVDNARGRSSRIAVIPGNGTSEGVRFSLNGKTYQNNSLVTLEDIGEWDDALLCITSSVCCYHYLRLIVGNWFFPNGTRVSSATKQWDFFRTRGQMVVNMHRRRGGVTGIYHCEIPDAMNVTQAIYIGVYTASTGQVTIRGEITFQLNTDPATDLPVFTLTCTSTGGPASTVSWRRDGTMLSDDNTYSITSQVTDAETATYNHTLTVTGRLLGEYQCSVSNIRTPSGSSRTLNVVAAGTPTNVNAYQVGPSSFRVSWTPPAIVSGYLVYWSGGGGADSGNITVGAWSRSVSITGLTPGLTYNITLVTLSDHLPSIAVTVMVYTPGTSEGVQFSLRGITYQNNSLVDLEDIGEWSDALLCVTDQSVCCRPPYGSPLGSWFFPNGTRLPSFYANYTTGTQWDFFRTRGQMVVNMHRRRGGVTGIYCCKMPDAMNVTQTIYIGVYTASTGQVTIPGDITFQLDTDPATALPVFTLTCTSTGGPATTVSWRRDGTMLSDNSTYIITSQVTDAETATYIHTLTVTGRLVGEYQCSVSNIRTPSGSSRTLRVVAAGSPTNLNTVQVNLTSFSVSWTPPATSTGYQVYWSGGGGYDRGNMSARADDRTVTITGRTPGLTYNITIVAFSDHLPSTVVGAVVVTLACPQVMDSEYLASVVVGTFIGTTLLYTVILLVSICALIYWNKRHRTTIGTQVTKLDGAIVMKECDAYGEVTVTGTDHIYATPQ